MLPATSTIFPVLGSCDSAAESDMPALIQQARQDAVRDVVAGKAACLANFCEADLRPMNLQCTCTLKKYPNVKSPGYTQCVITQ